MANGDDQKPWEKYKAQSAGATGPWTKYQAAPASKSGMTPPPGISIPAGATIRAADKPKGVAETISQFAGDTMDDIRLGTDKTIVGKGLRAMGARGTSSGNPEAVGEFMASPALGTARAVKGAAETTQSGKRWQGTKDVVGGAMQAAEIPLAFDVGGAAEAGAGAISKVIPSTRRAGLGFNEVMAAAKNVPVEIGASGNTALRMREFADTGAFLPPVVRKFVLRMTDPEKDALTYKEARDFYENATRLSADVRGKMQPQVKRLLGQFVQELKGEIGDAAERVGKRATYESAMREYHRASQLKRAGKKVAKTLPYVAAGAAGYEAVKNIAK